MKNMSEGICDRIDCLVEEMNRCLDWTYCSPDLSTRYMMYIQTKAKIHELQYLNSLMRTPQINETMKKFTVEELSKYNGKNGNPAYVAVEGIVYDVTNNSAWGAATHFGLSAGQDLTKEFMSCHAGKNILKVLKVVGMLV